MPPKARVTEDIILDAAIEVVRERGFENMNARSVSAHLHCSTQPVMYHFTTIDNLKRAAYRRADQLHTEFLMKIQPDESPLWGSA